MLLFTDNAVRRRNCDRIFILYSAFSHPNNGATISTFSAIKAFFLEFAFTFIIMIVIYLSDFSKYNKYPFYYRTNNRNRGLLILAYYKSIHDAWH